MSQQGGRHRRSSLAEMMIRTKSTGSDGKPTNSDPLRSLRRTSTRGSLAAESSSSTKALPANRHQRRHSTVARDFIKVIARIRPKLQNEVKVKSGVEVHRDGKTLIVKNERGDARQFCLDQIFDSQHAQGSQAEVFATFGRELVNHSLKGYNVCIFAYGHTGTGKTYTMLGDHAAQCNHGEPGEGTGLLPRFLGEVFRSHKEECEGAAVRNSRHYTCEYYEVYNEQIKDLLLPTGVERTRRVHVHPRHGVRIENLTTSIVSSAAEALQLVAFGNQMRAVAATTMNARSSRSHAIFTFRHEVTEETESLAGGDSCSSTVTLVDLAGREDQAVSRNKRDQFREMCFINTSLFHLTHLITKLADVPVSGGSLSDFRNSKLTLLLSPALIGNSRTALVATVAPGQNFYEDSVSTMQFATSVKKIQTRPIVNNKTSNVLVAELEAEVKQLQQELALSKTHEAEKEQALVSAQAIITGYRRSWNDMLVKSDEHRMIRQGSLASVGIMDNPHPGFGAIPRDASGRYLPFLTKLCDDPPLQGHCNFFLHQRPVTGIGSDPEVCHIILEGLGITACMCEVHCTNNEVEVRLHCGEGGPQGGTGCTGGLSSMASLFGSSSMGTRVIVNGRPLSFAEPERKLRHGDCLFLGYSHAFRLVNPCELESFKMGDEPIDAPSLVRATIQNLDTSSAAMQVVDETGTQFNAILPFISHLSSRTTKDKVQAFMKALHCVCPLVDEANIITAEVLPTDGIRLELHALTDVFKFSSDFPELVVAVLQEPHCRSFLTDFIFSEGDEDDEDDEAAWSSPSPSPMSSPKNNAEGGRERHPLITAMGLQSHMKVGGQENLLYVWSLEKFLWRLTGMRDVYQEGSEMKDGFRAVRRKMAAQPFRNPWRETTFADVQLMAETVMLARSASNAPPNREPASQPPPSSAAEDDGRGHTSEDPTPHASRASTSLSPATRVRTPFVVCREDESAQGEIDSDQRGTSSGPPAVLASVAAATQDSGSMSLDNPFTSSRSLPDDMTTFRSIDAVAAEAAASAERSANASSPPSRDSAMPTATESDSGFSGLPKHNMEVEQLCAEVLQLQKAVLNWSDTSIPRGPRQMLREGEKYTPRTDRKEQDGDQAQLIEAADSDSPLRKVMPEIRQRLVEMDMLQKRLKDDANVKSYSEGHESLHKLEKMRVNLAKLVRQGLQDHMLNLSGRPGTSSMPCSGTALKKPRGQRACLRAEVTSPVRQTTAPPRSSSAAAQTTPPEDVLVYCPTSRPQSARRSKGKAYRSSSMPERLTSQGSRGSASASSRPASKDPPATGNAAAGITSGAAPFRAAGPASAPAPAGGLRSSRYANPSPAAFMADMCTEQQSMAGPAIPYRQVGGFPLSVRRMREPVKAPIPFPACHRVPFTPRQDKRDPRLLSMPATAVASPEMAARASSAGCTPLPLRPAPQTQDPQSASNLGGGMPSMVFASAPPGPPPRGSFVSAAGAPVAPNTGSFVSGPSIIRSESASRIPLQGLSSSSQTVVPPSVPPLQPSAGDSPTNSSPKRTRHFIGPYPRVTWAYYEVTDPPSEATEPVVAKPASYTAPAPAPPHAMP